MLRYLGESMEALAEHPRTRLKIDAALSRLSTDTTSEGAQAAALHCRDAIVEFANSVFSLDFAATPDQVPSPNDAKARIDLTLAHFGELEASEDQRNLLKTILKSVLAGQHDREFTTREALSVVLLTIELLATLDRLIRAAAEREEFYQQYGLYKCGGCGRAKLTVEWIGDMDSDGIVSAYPYLLCDHCGWSPPGGI
ncbi:MAG: hypothetical protein IT580_24965 [Verrucomicrobiales bacterium]|nr:hypothetical protein [Verrucomicrobiales bacterium]